MNRRRIASIYLVILGLLASVLGGCGRPQLPNERQVSELRDQFLLSSEPLGGVSVLDLREGLQESGEAVTVVGRIGGQENPWSSGRASFMIADPTFEAPAEDSDAVPATSEHAHPSHDPDSCPFCRTHGEADAECLAVVQFQDEAGKIVPVDARDIFPVEVNQTVVITGTASLDGLGIMVIAARGIYVRR